MIRVSLQQLATHLNAKWLPGSGSDDIEIDDVSIDSRAMGCATLFVALKGDRFDGHDFASAAIKNGAVALLVERQLAVEQPQLVVADTRQALGHLGAWVRQQISPKVVALTGSNGKTTVKEMIATVLEQDRKVLYTAGNFNNDIGVPLTLLRLEPNDDVGVFELGANHEGEIAYTSALVQPDVALVNNVANAHLEGFGSLEGVAKAKSEIFNYLPAQGVAIINADDHFFRVMQQAAGDHPCLHFSTSADTAIQAKVDVCAREICADRYGCYQFELCYQGQQQLIQLRLVGRHQVANAVAAASACIALGVSLAQIAAGLATLLPVKGRMAPLKMGRLLVVDDSYNANPASVAAAIQWLQHIEGQTCLVLGDLGELGDNAATLHYQLGVDAKSSGVDKLFCVGQLSQACSDGFGAEHCPDFETLMSRLIECIQQTSTTMTVLVKGSRSAAMERVVEELSGAYERGELL